MGVTGKFKDKGRMSVGDEIYFGVTWRSMYSVKITSMDKDTATADITMPIGSPWPSVNIITINFTVKDQRMSRPELERLFKGFQGSLADVRKEFKKENQMSIKQALAQIDSEVKREDRAKLEETLKSLGLEDDLQLWSVNGPVKYGSLSGTLSHFLSAENGEVESIRLTDKNLLVKFKGAAGELKLDRRLELYYEYLTEKAGYIRIPLIFEDNRVPGFENCDECTLNFSDVKVGYDCSRDVQMEVFMSETTMKHPSCQKK
jgi:hypothetical protein